MKFQALFSSKDKSKKLKSRLLQFLYGALRVNKCMSIFEDMRGAIKILWSSFVTDRDLSRCYTGENQGNY